MHITLLGDNIEITEKMRDQIDQKIGQKLQKYLVNFNEDIKTAQMTLKKDTRWGWKINFDMRLPGKKHIFAESKQETFSSTLTSLREKLIKQIKEYKDTLNNNK